MKIKWFKDKDGAFWTYDVKNKEAYIIFKNKPKDFVIGIYRNIKVKRNGELTGSKPLFYDKFTFNKAKQIVKEIIKLNNKR